MTMVTNRSSGYGLGIGKYHEIFTGRESKTYATPDGDLAPFSTAPIGSLYMYEATGGGRLYIKVKDDNTDNDWYTTQGYVAQAFSYTDMTDSTTTGTLVLDGTIPAGAVVTSCELWDVVKWDNDTSAVIQVGDGSDADRYMTGTPDIFQTVGYLTLGAVSGTAYHATAVSTITVTVTTASDFTSVNAGSAVVVITFKMLN